jgi:DNA-directed RNA polymerase specialized sigma24 family protein
MISEKIVREDLENIKYYSVRRYVLDSYLKDFSKNDIVALIEKYNNAMKSAPIKFYHLYMLRYLKGYTQEEAADEIGFAINSIQAMQNSLILWLRKNIQKDD